MDTQTLDMEVFARSLTESQLDICEKDEKELGEIMGRGWSEETAVRFSRAMLTARRVSPEITVEGLMEVALSVGLSFVGDEDVLTRVMQGRENDVVVYGVQRRDGKDAKRTSGTVLLKNLPKKKNRVRGV